MSDQAPPLNRLFDLSGRVALITGGSRGLGLQIAEALGEAGAKVVLVARKPAELDEAKAHLTAGGVAAHIIAADLGETDAPARVAARALTDHKRIDILVNNAGTNWAAKAEEYPREAWDKLLNLNLTGLFQLTQAVARDAMIPAKRGRVLNIASISGFTGNYPNMSGTVGYNATKGAVINLTRALAAEWGRYGITVNAIAPGFFPSAMTRISIAQNEKFLLDTTPLNKLGGPEDLKGAALLFASDAGGHITGQILAIDGGATII